MRIKNIIIIINKLSLNPLCVCVCVSANTSCRNNYAPVKLFDAEVVKFVGDNFVPIKRTLEREIKGATDLILWTDGDREGENIGAEIVDACHNSKDQYYSNYR